MTFNPRTTDEWLVALSKAGLTGESTISSSDVEYHSASQLWTTQFLLFRVIWESGGNLIPLSKLFSQNIITAARSALEKNTAWQLYLDHLPRPSELRTANESDIGIFTLVRWHQLAINSPNLNDGDVSSSITPTKRLLERLPEDEREEARESYSFRSQPRRDYRESPGSHPSARGDSSESSYSPSGGSSEGSDSPNHRRGAGKQKEQAQETGGQNPAGEDPVVNIDEQIVNVALISLLDGIMISSRGIALETTSERKRFRYENLWTAVTDGYLRRLGDTEGVSAIIEVKAASRNRHRVKIQRQEAGEMVAWMFRDTEDIGEHRMLGGSGYWRLLIAQDRDEIWIVIAEYNNRYKEYIRQNTPITDLGPGTLNTMTEYGPFKMSERDHVSHFALFIQAFCLLQTQGVSGAPRAAGVNPLSNPGPSSRKGDDSFVERLKGLSLSAKTPSPDSSSTSSNESPSGGARRR